MFLAHKQLEKHNHSVRLLWTSEQPVAQAASCTTQIKQTTIEAVTGIRTRDPNNQKASDLGLDLVHRDQFFPLLLVHFVKNYFLNF